MTVYEKNMMISLVKKTQEGDQEAEEKLILQIYPLVAKYSRSMGYDLDEASQDLIEWLIKIIKQYQSIRKQ